MMMRATLPGVARPVRMAANSSLANSIARSIFSSASKRVSSITWSASFGRLRGSSTHDGRGLTGGDQGADLLAGDSAGDGVLALGAKDQHRQFVLLAQGERGRVDDLQTALQRLLEGHRIELARVRVGPWVGG